MSIRIAHVLVVGLFLRFPQIMLWLKAHGSGYFLVDYTQAEHSYSYSYSYSHSLLFLAVFCGIDLFLGKDNLKA